MAIAYKSGSDVKRGQNLEAEAEAEAKNNYEKVPNNDYYIMN